MCANPEIHGLVQSLDAIVDAFVYEGSLSGPGGFEQAAWWEDNQPLRQR
jgi:hypothetical protein